MPSPSPPQFPPQRPLDSSLPHASRRGSAGESLATGCGEDFAHVGAPFAVAEKVAQQGWGGAVTCGVLRGRENAAAEWGKKQKAPLG